MATNETATDKAASTQDYIEYLGDPQDPNAHGVTFLTSHEIPKTDPLWKRNRVEDVKAVKWERDPMGPPIGQKGNRFLVPIEDVTPAMVAVLEKTPGYRRVTE